MKIKVILTGTTGMVGEGVLQECLNHPEIEQILVINRRPCGIRNPKLTEILHSNFYDLSAIEDKLGGCNACFFCLGVTSVNKKAEEYHKLTYDLTIGFAKTLLKHNNEMTFCYISGAGTDSSEKGRINWARVKGKTENDLMKMPFKKVYAFRPGFLKPAKGAKNTHNFYYGLIILYPLLKLFLPKFVSTLKELGLAMINVTLKGYNKNVLEVEDIIALAKQ
jgi:hypothetical protein